MGDSFIHRRSADHVREIVIDSFDVGECFHDLRDGAPDSAPDVREGVKRVEPILVNGEDGVHDDLGSGSHGVVEKMVELGVFGSEVPNVKTVGYFERASAFFNGFGETEPWTDHPLVKLRKRHGSKGERGVSKEPFGGVGKTVEGVSAVGWMMSGEDVSTD